MNPRGFVNLSALHCETRDLYDRKPPAFGRLLFGRDVQAGKNQLKLTVPCRIQSRGVMGVELTPQRIKTRRFGGCQLLPPEAPSPWEAPGSTTV